MLPLQSQYSGGIGKADLCEFKTSLGLHKESLSQKKKKRQGDPENLPLGGKGTLRLSSRQDEESTTCS